MTDHDYKRLIGYSFKITRNFHVAQDVLQDALLQYYKYSKIKYEGEDLLKVLQTVYIKQAAQRFGKRLVKGKWVKKPMDYISDYGKAGHNRYSYEGEYASGHTSLRFTPIHIPEVYTKMNQEAEVVTQVLFSIRERIDKRYAGRGNYAADKQYTRQYFRFPKRLSTKEVRGNRVDQKSLHIHSVNN